MEFVDRLSNAWEIFKLSFKILKKDKSLIAIPIYIMIASAVLLVLFILIVIRGLSSSLATQNQQILLGNATLLFWALWGFYLFIFYFIMTFLVAAQSWMIYEVLLGKNTTVGSGFKRAFENFGDVLAFIFINLLIKIFTSFLRKKGGILGSIFGGILNYLTGLAGKLVLPAMIITERNFKESVEQLKDSLKAIPEIAIYEVGIRPLTTLTFFIGLFLAIILGYSFGFFIGIFFFLIWILLMIMLSTYVNQTYYTILYLTLIEKKKIKGLNIKI